MRDDNIVGLYNKYNITKADGTPVEGFKFVLSPQTDQAAFKALKKYAKETRNMMLKLDLEEILHAIQHSAVRYVVMNAARVDKNYVGLGRTLYTWKLTLKSVETNIRTEHYLTTKEDYTVLAGYHIDFNGTHFVRAGNGPVEPATTETLVGKPSYDVGSADTCAGMDGDEGKERLFEIWSEGFAATGERAGATFHNKVRSRTFKGACDVLAARSPKFNQYYDPERMTYWGCSLFDNEADARRSFG